MKEVNMEETTLRDVIVFIQKATSDDIDRIFAAAKARSKAARAEQAAVMAATLKKGDKVITRNLSPKYLSGLEATVVRLDGNKILVKVGEDEYTGRYGSELLVPASCLTKIGD